MDTQVSPPRGIFIMNEDKSIMVDSKWWNLQMSKIESQTEPVMDSEVVVSGEMPQVFARQDCFKR